VATVEFTVKELNHAGITPDCALCPIIALPSDTTFVTLSLLKHFVSICKTGQTLPIRTSGTTPGLPTFIEQQLMACLEYTKPSDVYQLLSVACTPGMFFHENQLSVCISKWIVNKQDDAWLIQYEYPPQLLHKAKHVLLPFMSNAYKFKLLLAGRKGLLILAGLQCQQFTFDAAAWDELVIKKQPASILETLIRLDYMLQATAPDLHITELDLSDCTLIESDIKQLVEVAFLRHLKLGHIDKLTDSSLLALTELSRLETLRIDGMKYNLQMRHKVSVKPNKHLSIDIEDRCKDCGRPNSDLYGAKAVYDCELCRSISRASTCDHELPDEDDIIDALEDARPGFYNGETGGLYFRDSDSCDRCHCLPAC
jgi:hypothetical protein